MKLVRVIGWATYGLGRMEQQVPNTRSLKAQHRLIDVKRRIGNDCNPTCWHRVPEETDLVAGVGQSCPDSTVTFQFASCDFTMPLVVFCGLPGSGKSTRALELFEHLKNLGRDVQIVNEESLNIDREDGYKGTLLMVIHILYPWKTKLNA